MKKIMMEIPVAKALNYTIIIDFGLLSNPVKWLPNDIVNKKLVIVTDDTVSEFYGKGLVYKLQHYQPLLLSFASGEKSKNYKTKIHLENQMLQHHCDRNTVILALGGGVVGDIAGFIASTYMRGVAYIQIPTTLLAMVDSSVGGKTGINNDEGKNLIGTFWQPNHVIVDLDCLNTLPDEHIINGLIEAIKMFITYNKDFFYYVYNHIDLILAKNQLCLQTVIEQAIQVKLEIVSQDINENNLRMILNFGHTIGHALEKLSNYNLLHGYAVALGILVEAKISQLIGILDEGTYILIRNLFSKLEIFSHQLKHININDLILATKIDKKIRANHVRYVLLKSIGNVYSENNTFVHEISDDTVKQAMLEVLKGNIYAG